MLNWRLFRLWPKGDSFWFKGQAKSEGKIFAYQKKKKKKKEKKYLMPEICRVCDKWQSRFRENGSISHQETQLDAVKNLFQNFYFTKN